MFFFFFSPLFLQSTLQCCTDDLPKDAEYKLAQSGDATCNGLESAEVSF